MGRTAKVIGVMVVGGVVGVAQAHTDMLSPNGGEILSGGSTVTVQWQTTIPHLIQNWDLWYSTVGADGPWVEMAMDLPPGPNLKGAVHAFDWTVPVIAAGEVWVRVRQDNQGKDYFDVSDGSFEIAPCPGDLDGDGDVDFEDLAALLGAWGTCPAPCASDIAAQDGVVDFSDLSVLLGQWGMCPEA